MRCKVVSGCVMSLFPALVALPACAVSPAGDSHGQAVSLPYVARADAAVQEEGGSSNVADSHLRLQFVLHRTSRYLYNSAGVISLAASADKTVPLEH